ncbi:outer membrane beta-barrel family protein [Gracilimonas mengyeensis]|nr:outer membrane beta-barrel family protein [Gracilimonas mengyeensis]
MKYLSVLLFFGLLGAFPSAVQAQSESAVITGTVLDENGSPLTNATIALYDEDDEERSELLTGAASKVDGTFSLRTEVDDYLLRITYLSYQPYETELDLSAGEELNLGEIRLQPDPAQMEDIEVEGQRSYMEMNFDSRSFNVNEDITSMGGSALDVLDNVPSITTDFEGNVSLRGNQGVQILINGRPTNLVRNGTDGLSSIPAGMIEEVKIITNPSARYSADGTGGIIDIILVDDAELGFNGSIRANTGWPQDHSIGTNLNYQTSKINWFLNSEFEFEKDPRSSRTFQSFSRDSTYAYQEASDWDEREMEGDINLGADIFFRNQQVLTIEGRVSLEEEREDRNINYTDYDPANNQVYRSVDPSWDILQEITREVEDQQRESDFDVRATYEKTFPEENHQFTADLDFEFGQEDAETRLNQAITTGQQDDLRERTFGGEIYRELRFDMDYERPIGENGRLEAGTRIEYETEDSDYLVEEFQNGNWERSDEELGISDNFEYLENVNAAYAIYSGELKPFTYQLGLRLENTRIQTELDETGAGSDQNYVDLFPSVFLSYTINEANSIQASYSRRISRPRSWYLLPFTEITDSRNRSTGNPNLKPEMGDSYELGYLRYWESGSVLTSVYYRHRTQVIDRVSIIDNNGITTRTPINLATEDAYGIEFSADQDLFDGLQLSGSLNFFESSQDGFYQGVNYSSETGSFTSRLRVRWQFMEGWNFQSYLFYRGAQETTQGTRAARSFVGSAISKELLDGKANISLNVRDLFNTRNSDREIIEPNSYTNSEFSWSSRSFRVNFRYNFGGGDNDRGGRGR